MTWITQVDPLAEVGTVGDLVPVTLLFPADVDPAAVPARTLQVDHLPWFRPVNMPGWLPHWERERLVIRGEALVRPRGWSTAPRGNIFVADQLRTVNLLGMPTAPLPGVLLAESVGDEVSVRIVSLREEGVRFESSDRSLRVVSRWVFSPLPRADARFVAVRVASHVFVYAEVTAYVSDAIQESAVQRHEVAWNIPKGVTGRVQVVVGVQYDTGWGLGKVFDVYRGWVEIDAPPSSPR